MYHKHVPCTDFLVFQDSLEYDNGDHYVDGDEEGVDLFVKMPKLKCNIIKELNDISQNSEKIDKSINEKAKKEQLSKILLNIDDRTPRARRVREFYNNELKKFKKKVLNITSIDELTKIKPKISFIDKGDDQNNQYWNFLHHCTASSKNFGRHGKVLNAFLIDETSGKYMAILSISSDKIDMQCRDRYIGWSREKRMSSNLYVCVSACLYVFLPIGLHV